ncbi:MAG TPA: GtrA family protein [Nitrososphaeraceae archaeon]|nr:GtrA family protein [Nitrososphaeraceae archaeon]
MLNPESKALTDDCDSKKSNKISVVLLTQDPLKPMFQSPHKVMSSIPRELSKEIIVVHYKSRNRTGDFDEALESTKGDAHYPHEKILHVRVEGEFASGVMKGIELSAGKYILVMDADLPYSRDIIPELVSALIANPNFIIVASRFVKDAHVQQIPFIQNAVGKTARIIARYGLKIKNVKDPTSACFAFSREIVKDIKFEGKGKEALLEILVKINSNKNNNNVSVKEIPIKQHNTVITRKLDRDRILNYSKDVWQLYRYGIKSKPNNSSDVAKPKRKLSKSVMFLSKAGRFFTVGASGLAVNYAASFLLTSLIPNIWYIHATLFGIILSITSNFILNKVWTFEDRNFSPRHFLRQYVLFFALCTLGAVIQLSLVFAFVEYADIQYAVSLLLAVCIASLSNFLLNKKITFGEKIWE